MKVIDVLKETDEKDAKKKLEILSYKEKCDKDIKRLKREINEEIENLNDFLNCDFDKIEMLSSYGYFPLRSKYWKYKRKEGLKKYE